MGKFNRKHATPNELQALVLLDGMIKSLRYELIAMVQKRQRVVKKIEQRIRGKR